MGAAGSVIHSLIRRAASAYIAGPAIEDARAACEMLRREGISSTVCYWDAYADPGFVSQAYIRLLSAMVTRGHSDCYLSVKAPALKFDVQCVRKVLEEAQRLNAIVHFDALAFDTVEQTFDLIAQARTIYPKLGCTLPSRWRRSIADADRCIELGLRIRVVKGEWKGRDEDEIDPREGFLNIVDRLAGRATHVAVATHNPMIARMSLRRLRNAGTPCELELLYGLPQQPLLRIARDFGVRARMYVPYGHSGLPYHLRQAAQSPKIIGWFIHDLFRANSR
jgi:proline dehydrogenase